MQAFVFSNTELGQKKHRGLTRVVPFSIHLRYIIARIPTSLLSSYSVLSHHLRKDPKKPPGFACFLHITPGVGLLKGVINVVMPRLFDLKLLFLS